jgi:hypothetical protein
MLWEISVAIAAPIIPKLGISTKFSAMFIIKTTRVNFKNQRCWLYAKMIILIIAEGAIKMKVVRRIMKLGTAGRYVAV